MNSEPLKDKVFYEPVSLGEERKPPMFYAKDVCSAVKGLKKELDELPYSYTYIVRVLEFIDKWFADAVEEGGYKTGVDLAKKKDYSVLMEEEGVIK